MKTQFQLNSQEVQNQSLISRLSVGSTYRLIPADLVPCPVEGSVAIDANAAFGYIVDLLPPDSVYTSTESPGAGIWTASGGIDTGRRYWLGSYNIATDRYLSVSGWPNYGPPTGNPPHGAFIGIIGTRQGSAQLSTREFGIGSSLNQQDPPDQAAQLLAALGSQPVDDVLVIDTVVHIDSDLVIGAALEQALEFRGNGALWFGQNGRLFLAGRTSGGVRIVAGRKRIFHWSTADPFPPIYGATTALGVRLDSEEVVPEWFGGGVEDTVECGALFSALMERVAHPQILSLRSGDFYTQSSPIIMSVNDWAIVCTSGSRYGGVTLRNSTGGTVLKGPDSGMVSHIRLQGLRFQGIGESQLEPVLDTGSIDSSTIVQCAVYNPKYGWRHAGSGGAIIWENCFFARDETYGENQPAPYLIDAGGPPLMIGCQIEGDRVIVRGGSIIPADFVSCHLERCPLILVQEGRANFIGGVITQSEVVFGPGSFLGSIKAHNGTYSVTDLGFCNTLETALKESVPKPARTSDIVHQGVPVTDTNSGAFILESGQYYLLSMGYDRRKEGGVLKVYSALPESQPVLGPESGLSEDSPPLYFEGDYAEPEPETTAPYTWGQQYAVIQAAENVHLLPMTRSVVRACIPLNTNPMLQLEAPSILPGYSLFGGNQLVEWEAAESGLRVLTSIGSGSWALGSTVLLDVSKTYALLAQVRLLNGANPGMPVPQLSIFGTISNQTESVLVVTGIQTAIRSDQTPVYTYSRLFSPRNHPAGDGRTGFSIGSTSGQAMDFEIQWLAIVEVDRRTEPAILESQPLFGTFRFPDEVRLLTPGSYRKVFCTSSTPTYPEGPGVVAGTMPESLSNTASVKRGEWWDYKGAVHICRESQAVTPIVLPDDPAGNQYWCSVLQPDGVSPVARADFKSI